MGLQTLAFVVSATFLSPPLLAEHAPVSKGPDLLPSVAPLKCESHIERLKSAGFVIPKCPQTDKSSLLTPDYPASAIFVRSFTPGQTLDVLDLVRAVGETNAPIVMNVMGRAAGIEKTLSEKYPNLTVMRDGKMLQTGKGNSRTVVNLVSGPSVGSTFLHDFGKQLVDSKGDTQFFTSRHAGNYSTKEGGTEFGDFLKKQCGISVVHPTPKVDEGVPATQAAFGGNYLPLTPNHLITGSPQADGSLDLNHQGHLKGLKELGLDHSVIDTSFLSVGHVDEIVAPVRVNRPEPCGLGLVVADTELGWKWVTREEEEKDPEDEAKKPTQSGSLFSLFPLAHAGITLLGKRKDSPVACRHMTLGLLEKLRMFDAGMLTEQQFLDQSAFDYDLSQSIDKILRQWGRLYAEDKKNFPLYTAMLKSAPPQFLKFFQTLVDRYCLGFSGISKIEYERNLGATPRQKALKKINTETIPAIMKQNEAKLKAELTRVTGCPDPTFIKVPTLYEEINGKMETILPNSVNLISLGVNQEGNQLIVPDSTSKEMDSQISEIFAKHGLVPHFSSSASCHLLQGDHSCSTSVFRACDPSPTPAQSDNPGD